MQGIAWQYFAEFAEQRDQKKGGEERGNRRRLRVRSERPAYAGDETALRSEDVEPRYVSFLNLWPAYTKTHRLHSL